ncbi:hypothetical protein [Stakelama marina]|uniref:Uncharacterized protein n=1 Tax=Stakelama marina TaxID=2826939 RepID=A0A8T4I7Q1_9SPHN|nr:hypothetical protein [Stakelama marina]MBR0551018.1 hypothetical protein [Stakelama marina]
MTWRGLFAGAVAGMLAAFFLAIPMRHSLGELTRARAGLSALRSAIEDTGTDRPLIAGNKVLRAASARAARAAIGNRVRGLANRGGVLVEAMGAGGDAGEGLAAVSVRLSGNEKAVIALADAIERGDPVMRFGSWRIRAIADGTVRLQGVLVAPWRA